MSEQKIEFRAPTWVGLFIGLVLGTVLVHKIINYQRDVTVNVEAPPAAPTTQRFTANKLVNENLFGLWALALKDENTGQEYIAIGNVRGVAITPCIPAGKVSNEPSRKTVGQD